MKKLTYFAILCLFSATAFANDPRHETAVPANQIAFAPDVKPQMVELMGKSKVTARVQRYDRDGHMLVTDVTRLGGRTSGQQQDKFLPEYTVKAVWTKN